MDACQENFRKSFQLPGFLSLLTPSPSPGFNLDDLKVNQSVEERIPLLGLMFGSLEDGGRDEPTLRCHQNPFIGALGIQEPVIPGEPLIEG